MAAKTTEREVASWLSAQINRVVESGGYPFEESSVETALAGKTSRFPDIVIWLNRVADEPFAFIEIKPPGELEDKKRLLDVSSRLNVKYAMTWNFNEAVLYYCKQDLNEKRRYPTYVLSNLEEYKNRQKRVFLKKHLVDFLDDFAELHYKGHLHRFKPDKYFFINLLHEATTSINEHFITHLRDRIRDKKLKKIIDEFIAAQGIPNLDTDEINKLISNQWTYGILTRLIFYLTIRRHFPDLPDIVKNLENTGSISDEIFVAFERARRVDWQAVFDPENKIEKVGIPKSCHNVLRDLLIKLDEYNFGELKEDIIGEIFENLIPENQKHKLGQYFTREDLVDLMIGFIVNEPNGDFCDPTCGSGTFLNRIYSRLRWLSDYRKKHNDILPHIWGFDIASFPAELATINLFRQDISNYRNFPRVRVIDFFDIRRGHKFEFPPPKAKAGSFKNIEQKVPQFDGLLGNFPFIRQEQIEKKITGYKKFLTEQLAIEWLQDYSQIFKTNLGLAHIDEIFSNGPASRDKQIKELVGAKKLDLKLSGQADIYVYLFIHGARFIKNGGRMGFITSNSFLDVRYGVELKKFFLDHFKIVAIVCSWVEPWFHFASVNTIFTIIERCDDANERDNNVAKFIKIKKPLEELIPFPDLVLEENKRWAHIDNIITSIENTEFKDIAKTGNIQSVENDTMRIRGVVQKQLRNELRAKGLNSKWGQYLRAPEVFTEIVNNQKIKFLQLKDVGRIRFGIKTGINDFFYLMATGLKAEDQKWQHVKNNKDWVGFIENRYLVPIIKSPKEADRIVLKKNRLKRFLFLCNKSKEELKAAGDNGALEYINWGEKQRTSGGVKWPDVPSVSGRKFWYSLGERTGCPILFQMINNDRFVVFYNQNMVFADHNLFEMDIQKRQALFITALLNSCFTALNRELISRINLGDGATKTEGIDWLNSVMVFDPSNISQSDKKLILEKFNKLKNRKILSIDKEIRKKDRIAFDKAVLKAVGLNPDKYLPQIYKGLVKIVNERLTLPKMRKKISSQKIELSLTTIKEQIKNEIIPDGLKRFPGSFLRSERNTKFFEIPTTGKILKIGHHFFGKFEIVDEEGNKIFEADSIDVAQYIICSWEPNEYIIRIPKSRVLVTNAVSDYKRYIIELHEKLVKRAFSATTDHNAADRIALELLRENGYTGDFDLYELS